MIATQTRRRVNLGCGGRYHPDWINIDVTHHDPAVIQADLSKGIPLPDASVDVVYHAAVLEHIRRADAPAFVAECYRVLAPGGVLRIGVPDLENLCRLYLAAVSGALAGNAHAQADYDWIMLELFDQTVRETSGGGMREYLQQQPIPHEEFIHERIGEEAHELIESLQEKPSQPAVRNVRDDIHRARIGLKSLPSTVRRRLPESLVNDADRRALELGRFRLGGEVHQWMYDRYSLGRLLTGAGFEKTERYSAFTSGIPDWTGFHLDSTPDGRAIKPDLFFMEGIKPGAAPR